MTSVSSATSPASATAGQIASAVSSDGSQDKFLTLLTAQMKNQDPLNPLDNAEVTSQMAQLETVTGVSKLNDTLASLKSGLDANAGIQASALIGKYVLAPADNLVAGNGPVAFGVQPAGAADSVRVDLVDGNGTVVQTMNLGASDGSLMQAQWDGTLADGSVALAGSYTMKITATSDGRAVSAAGLTYAQVESVALTSLGAQLHLADNRDVSVSQISTIN